MKNRQLVFGLVAFIFSACNFSVGTNKDLLSGLTLSNNGLSYSEGYLSMDNQKLSSNKFPMDKVIYLFFDGVEGFQETEGKVFLGASLVVTDASGNKILEEADLFASYNESGVSVEDAKKISLNLKIGNPMKVGAKYVWKSKIWDKKGKGVIEAESEFEVQ